MRPNQQGCNRKYGDLEWSLLVTDAVEEEIILTSNKGRAYFGLSGYHFNPDDITRILGIQPTTVNAAGASSGIGFYKVYGAWWTV